MRKTLVMAMVAALPMAAVAQSKVDIYGVIDMGASWRSNNIVKGVGSRYGIDSGQSAGSRLGFRGEEDLGNGLKAGFVLEQGMNVDRGTSAQGGRSFGRQSFLRLTSRQAGTLSLGHQYTEQYQLSVLVDPFVLGTVGRYSNVYLNEVRFSNALIYRSPEWDGFSLATGYSANTKDDETLDNKRDDVEALLIAPRYRNGPLVVGLNYHRMKSKKEGTDSDKIRVYDLMGTYDFGVVKLHGMLGARRADEVDYVSFGAKGKGKNSRMWMLGVSTKLGANDVHKLMASYVHRKTDLTVGDADAKVSQWAVGYTYSLSKRTNLYAAYAELSNNRTAKAYGLSGSVGDAINAGRGYQRGLNLGVRHLF